MRVLGSGIDTLEASFTGTLHPALASEVEYMKQAAQESDVPHLLDLAGCRFAVSGQGVKPWRWLLKGEDFHLRLSPSKSIPTASVRLLAIGLARLGHEECWHRASQAALACGDVRHTSLSRLDLHADVQGFEPDAEVMEGFVCPATDDSVYRSARKVQTFTYGRGEIVVRIYNKTAELAASGKGWMRDVWATCDEYRPEEPVWRIEYQLRRAYLRQVGVQTVEDAFGRLDDLWVSGLDWGDLRIPKGINTSRWEPHPAWEQLRALSPCGVIVPRIPATKSNATFEQMVPQVVGLLVSGGAALGLPDLDTMLAVTKRQAQRYLDGRGVTFAALVEQRARERFGSG